MKFIKVLLGMCLLNLGFSQGLNGYSIPNTDSAFSHLQEQMDKYHKSFGVYSDMDAGGNHYIPSERMQGTGGRAIYLNQACTSGVYSGITCIKAKYFADSASWAAVGWFDSIGFNLTGAETCYFWAKGERGGEIIRFEVGGPYDSIYRSITVALTNSWQRYTINLRGGNLSNVKRGFCWVAERVNNPNGATFYLDEIEYDLARLEQARFIHTYTPLFYRHDREWALNQAYTYTNALAMLAFLSRGTPDDIQRARLIGDAFAFSQDHDRFYTDGRLRNAYMTGDVRDQRTNKARLPGWWDDSLSQWCENRYQVGTYVGEMAWLMIAWLCYDSITHQNRYLQNAIRLGNWVADSCWDSTGIPGYTGGFEGWEDSIQRLRWKSVEHHLDLFAAFTWLYQATGNSIWQLRANRALNFVNSMWDSSAGYFRCGTKEDGGIDTLRVLDAQTWGLLATYDTVRYRRALNTAESYCRRETLARRGFCFSERGDGIWWEGTAQMSCAYKFIREFAKSDTFLKELRWAQDSSLGTNRKGIVATHPDSSYTGLDRFWGRWYYFRRLDIGATSWYIFAETGYNPFWNIGLPTAIDERNNSNHLSSGIKIKIHPNPIRTKSWIYYELQSPQKVTIRVYDISGNLLKTLVRQHQIPGTYFISWNGANNKGRKVSQGIYFYVITADEQMIQKKTIMLK